MVVDAIASLISTVLYAALSILPSSTLSLPVPNFGGGLNSEIGGWNPLVPVVEMTQIIAVIAGIVLPALLAYKAANWAYSHIPQLGGFGPGSG